MQTFTSKASVLLSSCLVSSALMSGCMVGPDFRTPPAPPVTSYTSKPIVSKTVSGGSTKSSAYAAQQFISGEDIPVQWWDLFHSPRLNAMVQQGLTHSPNLAAAEAALTQARELLNAQVGSAFYPSVTGQLGAQRQFINGSSTGVAPTISLFDVYTSGVSVSYTLDFFGGLRRTMEGLRAQVDYNAYLLRAAYLTLSTNIVSTAIAGASLRAQISATQKLIKDQADQYNIAQKQYSLGGISFPDVLNQQNLLANLQASLPALQQNLAKAESALAVLLGVLPSEVQCIDITLDELQLPTALPTSVPSSLVHRRPDILASEALLHAACAQVGVATANLYPQVPLTGNYGWAALSPSTLFKPGSLIWNYGGQILQPIFNGGSLTATKRAAEAAFRQAAGQYRQTVLQAFQSVSDTLRALENDAKILRATRLSEKTAQQSLHITGKQIRLGGASYLELLTSEQQYQQAKINLIKAEAARFADTAALFQALGGGWV